MLARIALLATGLTLTPSSPVDAQTVTPATASPADYAADANWLCRPGRQDACAVDLSSTIVEASGKTRLERFARAAAPSIDCFYVYPTVSLDKTPNSDLAAGPEERAVIENQFARFGAVCRTFAPLYRQVTLTALRAAMAGGSMTADREIGYADVLASWRHYLANDNNGRGVILIGHSQGSGVLKRLLQQEIDGKPIQKQLLSAMLIGTNILVPQGQAVGGDFKSIPLCTQSGQKGCVISYVSFRNDVPPPPNSRFGRTTQAGMSVACVNPAAIGATRAAPLDAYLSNRASVSGSQLPPPQWSKGKAIDTPFVKVPRLLTGRCVNQNNASYLEVRTNSVPGDPRTDTISGDVLNDGQVAADWGLHVVDVNLGMGDLVRIAGALGRSSRN
jgi:hypothetical protein